MDKNQFISLLKTKPDLAVMVNLVMEDEELLQLLFDMVSTEKTAIKFSASKIIRLLSEQRPKILYPFFEDVAAWLHHQSNVIKWDGIATLANLAALDGQDKFKAIYEDYFDLMRDRNKITSFNIIKQAWKIVLAKPELEDDITKRLLDVPKIPFFNRGQPSPGCMRVACGHVLDSFDHYFQQSSHQAEMIAFAKGQLGTSRESVAKKAEKFLEKNKPHEGK